MSSLHYHLQWSNSMLHLSPDSLYTKGIYSTNLCESVCEQYAGATAPRASQSIIQSEEWKRGMQKLVGSGLRRCRWEGVLNGTLPKTFTSILYIYWFSRGRERESMCVMSINSSAGMNWRRKVGQPQSDRLRQGAQNKISVSYTHHDLLLSALWPGK